MRHCIISSKTNNLVGQIRPDFAYEGMVELNSL